MKNLDGPVAVRGRLPTAAARKRHKGGSKWREDIMLEIPRQHKYKDISLVTSQRCRTRTRSIFEPNPRMARKENVTAPFVQIRADEFGNAGLVPQLQEANLLSILKFSPARKARHGSPAYA